MGVVDAEEERRRYEPKVPTILLTAEYKLKEGEPCKTVPAEVRKLFPHTSGCAPVQLLPCKSILASAPANLGAARHKPLQVGCVLSGGQAAGGHNCISGLFDCERLIRTQVPAIRDPSSHSLISAPMGNA